MELGVCIILVLVVLEKYFTSSTQRAPKGYSYALLPEDESQFEALILAGKLDFCQELLLLLTLLFHLLWRIMQFYGSASLHSLTGSHLLLSMSSSFYGAVSLVALSLCDLDRIATETKTTPTDNSPSFSTTLKLTT